MHSETIPPTVRELINRHIRSIDHAEAVLHLFSAPHETHDVDAIARRYAWARGTAAQVLADLAKSGIAAPVDAGYRLAINATDSATLTALADLYHRHPVTLVRAIYAAPFPMAPLIRDDRPGEDPMS
ncbi:MAG TPA: hypothetical protein VGM50_00700 [Gemmatimonadaceae bacterium]